ncbi:MAG: glycosyltransferase family 39 protein [Anaerolineae bacterium]|nr:glycosyltransferase family 39 protein [Anaerolineae bacterium]
MITTSLITTTKRQHQALLLAGILLILFASRMPRLLSFPMDVDELWTAWQSIGSLKQVLTWVPYDWSPLHYALVWVWQSLTSPHPLILRLLSVYLLLIGASCMYRLSQRLTKTPAAALIGMAAYGAFGYIIFLSVLLRGYALIYALTPLTLWLALRYFDRSTWRRAALLGISLAALFYTHLSAAAIFPFVGIFTLVLFPRRIWQWWRPAILALLLAAPLVAQQLPLVISRAPVVESAAAPPFFTALADWYVAFAGDGALLWLLLWLLALLIVLIRRSRLGIGIILWALAPALILLLNSRLGFFTLRHLAWTGVGLALLLALAVVALPRRLITGVLLLLLLLTWVPFPPDRYIWNDTKPNLEVFSALRQQWRDGDVVFVDPTTKPVPPETWDYFAAVYFPDGLPIVASPVGYRRVWYATIDGWNRPEDKALVEQGRIAEQFFGPWNFLVRLYEAPPDPAGILFENGPRFHGFDAVGTRTPGYLMTHEDDQVRLRLWWSVDQPLIADYGIVVQLLDQNGTLISQTADRAGSAEVPKETSQWQPDKLYVEEMTLPIPLKTWNGNPATVEYQVVLTVYQWWDGVRLSAPGVTAAKVLPLAPLHMTAW